MQQHLPLSWPPPTTPRPFTISLRNPNPNLTIRTSTATTPVSSSSSSHSPAILPNALRRRTDPTWTDGGFSLGVDLGNARTGLALSKGFSPRPLAVLELRGQKLELRLLEIADKEEVDEYVIGLPRSYDGKETPQSNKVRSIAGRFAVRAAERGLRVYLQDEHGSSLEALDFMIEIWYSKDTSQCLAVELNLFFLNNWSCKKSFSRVLPGNGTFKQKPMLTPHNLSAFKAYT